MLSLQREIQRYLIIAWHILALSAKSEKKRKKKKYGKILAEKDPGILDFKALYTILTRESQTIARWSKLQIAADSFKIQIYRS